MWRPDKTFACLILEQVGISLGGIILGHYLVREGESAKVEAALLVSGKI